MYAKSTVNSSGISVNGGVVLDHCDAKLIQCRVAISRLTEISRVLKSLEGTLKRSNGSKVIIPLMNYILAFYGGLSLNISEVLSRRLRLLSEFRMCKLGDVNPPLSSSPLKLGSELSDVSSDFKTYTENVYNRDLQYQVLQAALKLTQNALLLYDRKYKQCAMERSANRPTNISGRPSVLEESSFEDLIQPVDVPMALDLAVLIKDYENDTSDESFRKLNIQVLTKFREFTCERAFRPIKPYHTSLFRFSRASSLSQSKIIMNLPYWQFTMHRIYAMLLRILYLLNATKAFFRQIYIPNKAYFQAPRTQLHSPNVFEYRELLKTIESICSSTSDLSELTERAEQYGHQGTSLVVQPSNVSEAFDTDITAAVRKLKHYFQVTDNWLLTWKAIHESSLDKGNFASLDDSGLSKAVEERLAVDKLEFIERKNRESSNREQKRESALITSNDGPVKTIFRRSSLQRSRLSPTSSSASSPGSLSPASMSRSPSQTGKNGPKSSKRSTHGSNISSPLASRRSSVSGASTGLANKGTNVEGSTSGKNDAVLQKTGRKRSSSLQSSLGTPTVPDNNNPYRSNSLQAAATLNQRMVRNTFAKLSANLTGASTTTNSSTKGGRLNTPTKSSMQMLRSNSPSPRAPREMPNSKVDPRDKGQDLPDLDTLVLDEEKLTLVTPSSSSSTASTSIRSTGDSISSETSETLEGDPTAELLGTVVKKVRFTGVPPRTDKEDPKPKRKGWYKKPQVLHYPPPPPQFAIQQYRLRQEGQAFKKSLRDGDGGSGASQKRTSFISQGEVQMSSSHKLSSKLRDKLIR